MNITNGGEQLFWMHPKAEIAVNKIHGFLLAKANIPI
jgi:hypothetical protein